MGHLLIFSYHVSQFGLNSLVISAVGHDKLGNEILSDFDEKLLNHHISKVEYPTGTVQVELDNEGVPYYDIRENVAWDNIPFTDSMKGLAQRAKSCLFRFAFSAKYSVAHYNSPVFG